jgi:hypothetical protein
MLSNLISYVISGFRREVDENYVLLGYYATNSCKSLPKFRDTKAGKNNLSLKVLKELPVLVE